jgi:hypothetical protein
VKEQLKAAFGVGGAAAAAAGSGRGATKSDGEVRDLGVIQGKKVWWQKLLLLVASSHT